MITRARRSAVWGAGLACMLACGFAGGDDLSLPVSARLVSSESGPRDLHGDATYAAVYTISRADARALVATPMWWMHEGAGKWRTSRPSTRPSPRVEWQRGRLPEEVIEIAAVFGRETPDGRQPPEGMALRTYDFALKWVEGGWYRVLIVDVERRRVYYYRSTW